MGEVIGIQDIFTIIKKRLLLIVSITFLSVLISGIVNYFFLTPVYESSTQLLINRKNTNPQTGISINVQENLELINTYRLIIKSPAILNLVKADMDLDRSINELSNQISVSSEQNSQIVAITVQDPELKKAVEIANTIASQFENEIKVIMNIDNVTILSKANEDVSKNPIKPRPILNMLITFMASLIMMIGLILFLEYVDDTIKSEHDIKLILELPVLGSIPMKKVSDFHNKDNRNGFMVGGKKPWAFLRFLEKRKK